MIPGVRGVWVMGWEGVLNDGVQETYLSTEA